MNEQLVINGLLISYKAFVSKEQGKPALLFLHGWRSRADVWRPVVESLKSKVESNCYAMDLPGFGASQTPKQPMTVGDYAKIVAEFIKKLDLKNVIVVGHSFGGRVGIKLSSSHPELVSKLVLVDSAGFAMDPGKKSAMNIAAKIVKPFFKPKFMQGLRKKIYKQIGAEDYVATPELQQTFINITGEDLSADMSKIGCPTLMITGENDTDTPQSFAAKMQSLIPNSKLITLPNAGHFSFLDQPEKFTQELLNFIK